MMRATMNERYFYELIESNLAQLAMKLHITDQLERSVEKYLLRKFFIILQSINCVAQLTYLKG